MGEKFSGWDVAAKLVLLGPLLILMGIFVSKAESSALGLSTDFWGGFFLAVGITASAVWIALTVRHLTEGRRR